MNFKNKKLIIFDFDGTLVYSIPDLTLAVNKMLRHYDLSPLAVETVALFVGNGVKFLVFNSLKYALKENDNHEKISEELLPEAFNVFYKAYGDSLCKETFLYPGVFETLRYLHQKGYKMAICSNKPVNFIEPILDSLHIKQFFNTWIGEDSLPEKKPSATPLLHLAKITESTVEQSIMVGDSKNDVLAAQNAQMDSIGLSYGYNYNENIVNYDPTIVMDKFAELQKLF